MKKRDKNNEVATFRFGVIAEFVNGTRLNYGEKEKLLNEKVGRSYQIPYSNRSRLARTTIEGWILDYKNAGFRIEGLHPKTRSDKGIIKTIDEDLKRLIKEYKKSNPNLTVPAIVKILKSKKNISQDTELNFSTIYRFLKQEDLIKVNEDAKDKRKFEASHPNELWQSDVMHGPYVFVNGKKKKTYLIAIIDDFSRYIITSKFYYNERRETFLDCLRDGVTRRGLPSKLYVDNGSCFRALHLDQITAQLGIAIHHSRPYTPQGRGKIERWFQNVQKNFLQVFLTNYPEATEKQLQEQFENWVEEYNNTEHSSTGFTPHRKYQDHIECTRSAPPGLISYFREIEFRRVKKDRTVKLNGLSFEVPVQLIDRKVELKFFPDDMTQVEVFFENKSYGMTQLVDIYVNSQIGRNWDSSEKNEPKKDKSDNLNDEKKEIRSGLLSFKSEASK
jgi:transposase InsO family protein